MRQPDHGLVVAVHIKLACPLRSQAFILSSPEQLLRCPAGAHRGVVAHHGETICERAASSDATIKPLARPSRVRSRQIGRCG
jgi:hypothetical protein